MSETKLPSEIEQEGEVLPAPRLKLDAQGRALPRTDAERAADVERGRRLMERLAAIPNDDPPGETEALMRAIDAGRPERPLFEGYY